jgi:hypothetical protein
MPASRTGQNRVTGAWSQARTHQLIALQLLLAAQTANGFTVGIGRDTAWCLDGWFHTFLEAGAANARAAPNTVRRVYHAHVVRQGTRSRPREFCASRRLDPTRMAVGWHELQFSFEEG